MTATIISTPPALCNKNGNVHKAKLARLERAMQSAHPRAFIALTDRFSVIEIQASEAIFCGEDADQSLRTAFRQAVASCGY
jgi:hypothetical protein